MKAGLMKRIGSSLRWEVALQFRNGFYYAVGFILVFWVILYTQLAQLELPVLPVFRAALPGLLLGNLLVTTFYFMAGVVMLEKGEGSLEARVVTPLRSWEFLLVKVLALSLLVLAENLVITMLFSGIRFAPLPLVLGLLCSGTILSLTGFLAVVRYDSINEFLLPSMGYTLLLMLPLLDFFGVIPGQMLRPLIYLHPLQAGLVLMEGGFRPLSGLEWAYGLLYSLAGVVILFQLGRRAFRHFVTNR